MSQISNFIKRMISPVAIIIIIVVMSITAYNSIMFGEEQRCWRNLKDTSETINNEISVRFKDNISILKLAANAMVQENRVESYAAITKHINAFQSMTIFNRIDLLYPDNTLLMQNGEMKNVKDRCSFEQIAMKGEHMSERTKDIVDDSEVICYSVPVVSKGKILAALIGVIKCKDMPSLFKTRAYDGKAFSCLIDYRDGSFILDNWHKSLGNMFKMKQRKTLKGYEHVDLISDVKQAKTGVTAYKSAMNGENSFMYYTPVGIFNWELLIVVQEKVAFASQLQLKHTLILLGTVEAILLMLYFIWTFFTVSQLEKSKKEIEEKRCEFEQLSYTDTLTKLFNRNKYNEVVEKYQKHHPENLGIAFFDLNGLKEVNDEQGHKAGDILIQNAAKNINSIFNNLSFRIGGDEFITIASNIDENIFSSKVNEIRMLMAKNKINISIGNAWKNNEYSFDDLLREADKKMYEEKRSYYENQDGNHDRRRR